jgi:hypothetical protein
MGAEGANDVVATTSQEVPETVEASEAAAAGRGARSADRRPHAARSYKVLWPQAIVLLTLGFMLGALSGVGPPVQASEPVGPSTPQSSGPSTPLDPFGLIAVKPYPGCDVAKVPASCPSAPFAAGAASNPAIAGLMLRVPWKDMQPSSNADSATNWAITDTVFMQAEESTSISQPRGPSGPSAQKFVVLAFVPGFDTPSWALTGVQTARFCTPYGVGAGTTAVLPIPWDTTYQAEWSAFLQQVATHYANKPDLLMISAAGPTSVSDEMSLPGAEESGKAKCSAAAVDDDISTWKGLTPPYTPSTYESAWTTAFGQYAASFPNQYTSFSLYPGLPIGKTGATNRKERQDTPQSITTSGSAIFGAKFALQANGLTHASGGPDDTMYELVSQSTGTMVTGYQLVESATKDLAHIQEEGGSTLTAADAATALNNALQAGLMSKGGAPTNVDFLQIYEDDAAGTDSGVQSVLQNVASNLPLPRPLNYSLPAPHPVCPPGSGTARTCS